VGEGGVRPHPASPAASRIPGGDRTPAPSVGACANSGDADKTPAAVLRRRPVRAFDTRDRRSRRENAGWSAAGSERRPCSPDSAPHPELGPARHSTDTLGPLSRTVCRQPGREDSAPGPVPGPVIRNIRKKGRFTKDEPVVLIHLTPLLQERIAALVRIIRKQQLQHVVIPLIAAEARSCRLRRCSKVGRYLGYTDRDRGLIGAAASDPKPTSCPCATVVLQEGHLCDETQCALHESWLLQGIWRRERDAATRHVSLRLAPIMVPVCPLARLQYLLPQRDR
jgi:hypothetical protein